MAVERWVAGVGIGLTWASCAGSELNSLSNGNAVQSSVVVTNGTNLDLLCDVSISLGSVASGSGVPFIGLYFYPLNQDGTSYGDGRFGSAAAGPPPTAYFVGSIPVVASVTAVIVGMVRGIWLPPGSGVFTFYNQAGIATAASSNTAKYRTYDRQVA